jgi:hypothetical protein
MIRYKKPCSNKLRECKYLGHLQAPTGSSELIYKPSFRYVECQFAALVQCPRTKAHLLKCLESLPHSLDETYERMLCNISATCIEDAQRILAVLCFSARPLTVTELIDAHASNLDGSSQFSLDDRRLDVESLVEI